MIKICCVCELSGSVAKYKCPKCTIPYCSLTCWKRHKSTNCELPVAAKEVNSLSKLPGYHYITEDTVPLEKLSLLKNSKTLNEILSNPHVRDILVAVDKSEDPSTIIQAAMLEPIFVEFADKCISILEPYSEKNNYIMMAREEKQLESALDAIIQRVNDLKSAIAGMIYKLEHEYETLNWPAFLDNFALISGQLTALSKRLTHDKSPPLSNLTVLPLLLSPERDDELAQMTEHRVTTFAHDLVPDYLRTKPEPDVETKINHLETKASSLSFETTQKQMAAYSKVVSHVWEIVSKAREEWESEGGARGGAAQTSSVTDTHALVAAVAMGKGLKVMVPQGVQPNVPQGMMVAPPGSGPMNPNQPPQMGPMGKAPSGIKTNIKAATQIHPYGR